MKKVQTNLNLLLSSICFMFSTILVWVFLSDILNVFNFEELVWEAGIHMDLNTTSAIVALGFPVAIIMATISSICVGCFLHVYTYSLEKE